MSERRSWIEMNREAGAALVIGVALVFGGLAERAAGGTEMIESPTEGSYEPDQEAARLVTHVHDIFQAFLNRDREAIERLHARDWVGFLGPSTSIERGIEDYMAGAERSLESFRGVAYEILDTEVRIYGDVGLVFYVATYTYDNGGESGVIPLRSVDVFERREGDWVQTASHISVVPSGGRWGEGGSSPDAAEGD